MNALDPRGAWISTYSGRPFWPLAPRVEDVRLADIAHALSHLCRFAGHTVAFYSVAQHAVLVSHHCAPDDALWGLLHDTSEAYLCDLVAPLKRTPDLDGYRVVERQLQQVIAAAFGLPPEEPFSVKAADRLLLRTEQRDLMAMPDGWRPAGATLPGRLVPVSPAEAKQAFLLRFHELTAGREGGR